MRMKIGLQINTPEVLNIDYTLKKKLSQLDFTLSELIQSL